MSLSYEDLQAQKEHLISADLEFEDRAVHSQEPLRVLGYKALCKLGASVRPGQLYRGGWVRRFAYCFVPQPLRTCVWGDKPKEQKQFPTTYLSGLRGITSIKVFTYHFCDAYTTATHVGWGADDNHRYLIELPVIRYFFAGTTAHVFFGVAGYLTVLRLAPLMERHDQASRSKILLNVSGSLFRRALRLYLPTLIITFITANYIYSGFYEKNRVLLAQKQGLFHGPMEEPRPEQCASYFEQLRLWYYEMVPLSNIFKDGYIFPKHDAHLWSIRSEMQGSLLMYLIVLATVQCRRNHRLAVMCAMTVVVIFLWDRWDFGVYIMGGIVGQIDAIMTENAKEKEMSLSVNPIQSTPTEKPSIDDTPSRIWAAARAVGARITKLFGRHKYLSNNVLHTLGLLIAFYFLSFPDWDYERSNGYVFLTKLIPSWITYRTKFYPMIGTALFIFLLARSDPQHSRWRKLLNSSLAQYLGTISFAVYLVHGPILHAIGYMIPQYMWWFLGTEGSEPGMLPWLLVLLVGWVLSLLLVIMVADIWSREVDGRCAKLVKKLEEICFQKA